MPRRSESKPLTIERLVRKIDARCRTVPEPTKVCFAASLDFATSGRVHRELYKFCGGRDTDFKLGMLTEEPYVDVALEAVQTTIIQNGPPIHLEVSSSNFLPPSDVLCRVEICKPFYQQVNIPTGPIRQQLREGANAILNTLGKQTEGDEHLIKAVVLAVPGHAASIRKAMSGELVYFNPAQEGYVSLIDQQSASRLVRRAYSRGAVVLVKEKVISE